MKKAEKDAVVTAAAAQPAKPAKKAAPKAKAPAQKVEELVLQFGAQEWNMSDLMDRAKAAYVAEGHRASAVKKLVLYVKPEEQKAYYVVNEKATGSIDL